jgi:hypothetical protein
MAKTWTMVNGAGLSAHRGREPGIDTSSGS